MMDPAVLLKMLADLSLWFATAGTLLPGAVTGASAPAVFALLSLSGTLGSLPDEKRARLRFFALIPLACSGFFITGLESALLFAPPMLYTAAAVILKRYSFDRAEFASFYKKAVCALAVWLLLALLFGGAERIGGSVAVFSVCFAACGVTLLRCLRQEASVRREPRFMLLCMAAPAVVTAAAVVLSLPQVTSAMGTALKFVYQNLISPILMLFAYVMVGVAYVVGAVIGEIKPADPTKNELELGKTELGEDMEKYLRSARQSESAKQVMIALGICAFLAVAFFVFRRMLGRKKSSDALRQTAEIRSAASPYKNERPLASLLRPRTPAGLVRGYYARFLRRAEAAGIDLPLFFTSEMISLAVRGAFPEDAAEGLRGIYIRARYGGTVTREDAKRARAFLDRLKYDPAKTA